MLFTSGIVRWSLKNESVQESTTKKSLREIANDKVIQESTTKKSLREIANDKVIQKSTTKKSLRGIANDKVIQKSTTKKSLRGIANDKVIQESTLKAFSTQQYLPMKAESRIYITSFLVNFFVYMLKCSYI